MAQVVFSPRVTEYKNNIARDCWSIVVQRLRELEGIDEVTKAHKQRFSLSLDHIAIGLFVLSSRTVPLYWYDFDLFASMGDLYPEIRKYKENGPLWQTASPEHYIKRINHYYQGYIFLVHKNGMCYKTKICVPEDLINIVFWSTSEFYDRQWVVESCAIGRRYVNFKMNQINRNFAHAQWMQMQGDDTAVIYMPWRSDSE